MNSLDEVTRRLPAIVHGIMVLLSVPYVLLAVFFVIVGRVASQRGLWAVFETFLNSLNWALHWGVLILGVTLISLLGMGFIEPLRWWAALALTLIITVTLGILLFYPKTPPTVEELVFLAPAFLILATSCWTLFR